MTDRITKGRCIICDGKGEFFQVWAGHELLEAWWSHDVHPEDGHDFRII